MSLYSEFSRTQLTTSSHKWAWFNWCGINIYAISHDYYFFNFEYLYGQDFLAGLLFTSCSSPLGGSRDCHKHVAWLVPQVTSL